MKKTILTIALTAIATVALTVTVQKMQNIQPQKQSVEAESAPKKRPRQPRWQESSQSLFQGDITVDPGTHFRLAFIVPANVRDSEIKGTFRASGGSGNDIKTFVFDATQYENYRNRHDTPALYRSGQVTVGEVIAPLRREGTYYLVFDNRFSTRSVKRVSANVSLHFKQLN